MALMICPECKQEASSEAADCPHCGYPINARPIQANSGAGQQPFFVGSNFPVSAAKPQRRNPGYGIFCLLLGLGFIMFGIFGGDTEPMKMTSDPSSATVTGGGFFIADGVGAIIVGIWMLAKR